MRGTAARLLDYADVSSRHFELLKRPGLIFPEAALRRRSICYSGSPPLVLAYLGSNYNTDGSPLSFSFGAADSHRYLIAATGVTATPTVSLTIGGVAASQLVTRNENFKWSQTGIYIALVPSGTSGTIATSPTGANFAAALYSAINLRSATAYATDSDSSQVSAQPLSMSLGVQAGGFIIANSFAGGNPSSTTTWTGLSPDVDFRFTQLSFAGLFSCGNIQSATAATKNMTVVSGGVAGVTCCAVSLR